MDEEEFQFWIDVGGTFTDCFARRPDGGLLRHKVLSSAVTKGQVAAGSSSSELVDFARKNDPPGFWEGYRLRLLDASGQVVQESTVARFSASAGVLHVAPALSRPPVEGQSYELVADEEAPILAIRYLMGLPLQRPIPRVTVRLGTTRGTNALLTRHGAKTALVTTRGFGDILRIGYQNRPKLFDLRTRKQPPLFSSVVEIDERMTSGGEVLVAPSFDHVRAALHDARGQGAESLAICLLNSYAHGEHEDLVERAAREVGFDEISKSSQVSPLIKIVSRGDTTVVDAYLNPVLRQYVASLRESLGKDSDLRLLTSAGGLVAADHFVGKDSILSGPAGGVVGFSKVAQAAGFERAIGFDMGGTSTDVSRFDGRFDVEYETEKAGVRIVSPMMAIETVAAGGGSICWFDGVKFAVGPDSAGADPGPMCYGRGGPLTVTDVNLFLGRIVAEHFPFPLDRSAVQQRLNALCDEINAAAGTRFGPVELANGFLRVANANMTKAIRSISVAKGYDPRHYVLVAFGGAAPQHACAIAAELGMQHILNHPDAGILSAYGIGLADVVRHKAEGIYQQYNDSTLSRLDQVFDRLSQTAYQEVVDEGVAEDRVEVRRSLDLRYQGLDSYLTILRPDDGDYAREYEQEHRRLYGYIQQDKRLEVVAARVEATGRSAATLARSTKAEPTSPTPARSVSAYFDAQPRETKIFRRHDLRPGDLFSGPAIVLEDVSTTVVDPGWNAEMLSGGELLISVAAREDVAVGGESAEAFEVALELPASPDPVMLEIFNNQFAGIAEQMGITLRNTASSVNVKERLDFSCALFTPVGDLVVNAPHIPVHLGAMGETVRQIIADNPDMQPGDVMVTNDPYRGGSHLPDITVVSPVHQDGELLFFTASRAHHAEIGGITPGSMPPFSRNLSEEGVLIRNFKIVAAGDSRIEAFRALLLDGAYPTRGVEENLADVAAQIAANEHGSRDLLALIERYSLPVVQAYMGYIQKAAETKMRMALARFPDGRHEFTDHLDDGSPITVAITVNRDTAVVDFTGTASVLAGNLNANRAIVTAAVMYCLRCLIDEDIPLNQGVLAPIEIVLPPCLLNPPGQDDPSQCAAMVGGNVETSQRVVDVLLGALGLAAASQGTMNNLTFGDGTFGYYETICGGAGATATSDGADAIHTHMTNTRLTDPEVIEQRYPVRVREFAIRQGSGGQGHHHGGNGVIRKLEFLKPLQVSILSQRRGEKRPYGLAGGEPGAAGENILHRASGEVERLGEAVQLRADAGDCLEIRTPGGGGFGNR